MSVSGDSAEQVVRLSLEGFEVIARLTGSGAKNIAAMLYTIMKDQKQTKGKTKLNNMIKSGKALKIFSIKKEDLKMFQKNADSYGILYSALIDKKNKNLDGMVDIMVRDEDAPRINRIVERFKLTTIDTAKVQTVVQKAIEDLLEEVLSQKPIQKENVQPENFNYAMTVKNPQSEHSSKTLIKTEGVSKPLNKKKSVRKELAEIKEEVRKEAAIKEKAQVKDVKVVATQKQKAPKVKDAR